MSAQTQGLLSFEPSPEPLRRIGVLPEAIADAQKPATLAVLARLREGPATTHDLIALQYMDRKGKLIRGCGRFNARIDELRSVGWTIEKEHTSERGWTYTLTGRGFEAYPEEPKA